jgi:hypothetical protein
LGKAEGESGRRRTEGESGRRRTEGKRGRQETGEEVSRLPFAFFSSLILHPSSLPAIGIRNNRQ